MSKFKRNVEEEAIEIKRFRDYSDSELREFSEELEKKYRVKRLDDKGTVLSFIDFDRYLQDKGAISKDGAVIINNLKVVKCSQHRDCHSYTCDLSDYEILNDKWKQLCKFKGRVGYNKISLINDEKSKLESAFKK